MSAATMPSAPTPVTDGLFTLTAEGPRLLGSRCASCATVYFPKAISCRNPVCRDKAVSDAQLPSGGTLFSYTIQHYRPPPLFRDDDWKPYAIGVVELGEGLQVMGFVTTAQFDEWVDARRMLGAASAPSCRHTPASTGPRTAWATRHKTPAVALGGVTG